MHNLHSHFKGNGGLTRANLAGMDEKDLDAQIRGVGFHNTKTRNLIKVANILKEQFNGKVRGMGYSSHSLESSTIIRRVEKLLHQGDVMMT